MGIICDRPSLTHLDRLVRILTFAKRYAMVWNTCVLFGVIVWIVTIKQGHSIDKECPYVNQCSKKTAADLYAQSGSRQCAKMKIVIVGSTGRVGSNLLKSALEKGHDVLAIARHPENIKVTHDNLQIKNINIFNESAISAELKDKDVLISCLGQSGSLFNRAPVTIYTDTIPIFSSAMRNSGMSRLVVMSGWPITMDAVPWWARPIASLFYKNIMTNMREMEQYLEEKCADLDYTAVKMPTGTRAQESGKPILAHEGQSVPGGGTTITYGDVSKFILENCLRDGEWKKKLVSICGS